MSRTKFDRAKVQAALDLIADHGFGRFDLLKSQMEGQFDMRFSFRSGTHAVRLMGVTGTGTAGYRDALDSWARAARRRLLREAV